jgi:microcystin-dependent protein
MESYIATIQPFAFNFAPRGWCFCDGRLLPISQYTAVFSLVGTTYGGNGQTTFGIPDLRGRIAAGQGNGPGLAPRVMGEMAGVEQTTILITNLPAHNHPLLAQSATGNASTPSGAEFLAGCAGEDANLGAVAVQAYGPGPASTSLNPGSIGISGGSQPLPILNPFLTINYSFCLEGIFPSRN